MDALLVERGLAESRSRAQGMILAGSVRVGDAVVTKAGSRIGADEPLSVETGRTLRVARRRETGRGHRRVRRAGGGTFLPRCRGIDGRVYRRTPATRSRAGCSPSTWATASSPGRCATIHACTRHGADQRAPLGRRGSAFPARPPGGGPLFHLAHGRAGELFSTTPRCGRRYCSSSPSSRLGPSRLDAAGLVRDREVHAAVIRGVAGYFGTARLRCRRGDAGGRRRKEVGEPGVPGAPAAGERSKTWTRRASVRWSAVGEHHGTPPESAGSASSPTPG